MVSASGSCMSEIMEELRDKMIVATCYSLSIPELFPMVGLRKDQGGFPALNEDRSTDRGHSGRMKMLSSQDKNNTHEDIAQRGPDYCCHGRGIDHAYSDSDPRSVLMKASTLLNANCYETMLQVLGVLDLHLMLPADCHMAKEFGCGLANQKLGRRKDAKRCFNSLMELASSYNSTSNYALVCQSLGEIEMSCGNFANAEKHFSNAAKYFTLDTVATVFDVELSESSLYLKLGQCQKALQKYKDSISSISNAIELAKNAEELLDANMNMGHAYMNLHDYKQCLHYYKESLRLSVELRDHRSEGMSHGHIGSALVHLNDKVCAIEHLTIAYHFSARYDRNSSAVGKAVLNLANGYAAIDDINKALEYYKTARDHFIYTGDSQAEGRACGNIGNMYMILKDHGKAIEYYNEALILVRDTSSKEAAYHNRCLAKFEIAVAQEDYVNALVLAEETRARSVKKMSVNSDFQSTSNPMVPEDIYKTVTLHKVSVVFTSYCTSKLLMWVLVPNKDEVKMKCCLIHLKDFGNSSFEQYIQCKLLEVGFNLFESPSHEQEEAFVRLYDKIGKEIEGAFEELGVDTITEFIFIPDHVTYLLPLSAMLDKERSEVFGDRYRIRIYPSILSLQMINMVHTNKVIQISKNERDCLVVGNPKIPPFIHDNTQLNLGRLPYAEVEAKQVASILGMTPLVREHATKQGVLYWIRNAKIIHIATHGSGSTGFLAFSSSFPISKEGYAKPEEVLIYPSDIEALNISSALVVLSSCQANRGSNTNDGIMGMAGAFLRAGAHSVLVSSFSVADESICVFMELFYRFLMDGFSNSQALQRTTQCMRCMRRFCGYNHWAGFQLIGRDISILQKTDHLYPMLSIKQLGKTSLFPREAVEDIKHALQNNTDKVQLLMGLAGAEPEECAKDYIKKYYYLYLRGVYWLNGSDELMFETSMKLANMTCENESSGYRQKRLIVIDNISRKIKVEELMDNKTDIIVINNDIVNEDDIQRHIEDKCSRPVNIVSVKSLATTEVLKQVTYSLLKRSTFSPQDSHVQLFNNLSELAMGTVTMTNIVMALFTNMHIDEIATKLDHCIKSLTVEKEHYNSSTNVLVTCNALIKSFISPESQMLLNSLSIVGMYGIPIPYFIIEEVEKLICSSVTSERCYFNELEKFSIICKYPNPCVYKTTEKTANLSEQYTDFYYIPKLICNAVLEQSDDAEHLLSILMLLKAIELNISEDDIRGDEIILELMFEILTILCNHSDNNQLLSKCMQLKIKIAYILHYSI